MLLTGLPPFRGTKESLVEAKHRGSVDFDIVVPSAQAQSLVMGLLQVLPGNRLTIEEVLAHEWMVEADDCLQENDLSMALEGLKCFQNVQNAQ